ncbi:uncharacterized protein LOC111038911 [Myzus persicae]|uniref:uncharacterized protein LOC111037583 n=2 Tax=Myzus persicae TaxID=13164 RepID=UPI000B93597C|nr:uncharacterized protein LOC111037583 [Myzus persicae]XP_022177879.1 uncharacterized protein LOC111038911 [Myzus persicae]
MAICDRNSLTSNFSRGGGALIAIRSDIVSNLIYTPATNVEHLFVKFNYNNINYVVCSVYFPPNCPLSAYESFISAVQSVLPLHPECVFIFCGDFNLPDIIWSNDDFGLLYNTVTNPRVQCIPDAFAFLNFFQLNDIQNSFGVVLDLVFSNDNRIYISKAVTSAVPCDLYHPALDIMIKLDKLSPLLDRSHNYYDFRRAPYSKICEFLNSFNWFETIISLDVDEAAKAIYDALHFCILNFVPEVSYIPSTFPKWFSKNLKHIVLSKKRAHAKFKASRCPLDYAEFSALRASYKAEYKRCHTAYLSRTESMLKSNPRSFWDFVRVNKSSNEIPHSVHFENLQSSGTESVSNLFSHYFNTVYVPPLSNDHSSPFLFHDLPSTCSFDIDDVDAGLDALKNVKSVGPDGLSGIFLYNVKSSLCFPLWLLFKRSIDSGVFPSSFKISSVTPIFKSGDKADVKNYRPVSILSHISKLFELLVLRSIQSPINSILIDEQHGFRPGRSTTTNLLVFNNFVMKAVEKHIQVDVIFTDFTKAFDRVDHGCLIETLYKTGFGEPLLSWFKSYLSDRVQWVKVFGCKSSVSKVSSGVPQGGHLSPILFSLYVNGIKEIVKNCELLMFADDLKLFRKIDNLSDCSTLQNDLNNLVSWFNNIGLQFNVNKCHSMSFLRHRSPINYAYSINGSSVTSVCSKKDLGIIFNSDLNFHSHTEMICCKALKTLGFVMRISKEFNLSSSLKTIYCSLVRSLLEYASVLWDPYTVSDSCQLERVQRRFLSCAAFLLKINHPPHDYFLVMQELSLISLADRRVNANIEFLNKLVDGRIDAPSLLSIVNFKVPSRTTRYHAPFVVPAHTTNYGRNNPLDRMMRLANESTVHQN